VAEPGGERSAASSRAVAAVVALAATAVLIVVALATGGSDGEEEKKAGLRVEISTSSPEVLVYVRDRTDNVPDAAGGARSVTVVCVAGDGEVLIRAAQGWPFSDTDGGTIGPHVHLPLDPASLQRVSSCRLEGTEPTLEGKVL
jgi:hypothetical protein